MENGLNAALRLLETSIENLSQHCYDEFIEKNAKAMQQNGVNTVIVRRQVSKCCEWCARLSGVYDYGKREYPEDIFKRHANCKCMVTVRTENGTYQDVWSKKEFNSQREARVNREKEIKAEDDTLQDFIKKKLLAKNRGDRFVNATEYYKKRKRMYPEGVINTPETFDYNGRTYVQDGKRVFMDDDKDAVRVGQIISEEYGGIVQRFPQIQIEDGIKTPDFLWNNEKYDVKKIKDKSTNSEALYNAVHKKREQASRFVFDISNTGLSNEKWIEESKKLFSRIKWLEEVILVKDDSVLIVLKTVQK